MAKNKKNINLSELINDLTYNDYLNRLTKICLSMFEWINLPKSMNPIFLEKSLFLFGQAVLLKDDKFGFINTDSSSCGNLNIYHLPTKLNCFSLQFRTTRELYCGINDENEQNNSCILVQNNFEMTSTFESIQLFAYRLAEIERTIDINLNAQKTPLLILTNEKQLLSMKNTYNKVQNNGFVIYGDKDTFDESSIKVIKTDAPFLIDKLQTQKKEIWNEVLTFLGINNIITEKKERMINDEVNSNNELINLNLQSFLAPRQLACEQFNTLFNLDEKDKISVRIRSDLHNIIKNTLSNIIDYQNLNDNIDENIKEGG